MKFIIKENQLEKVSAKKKAIILSKLFDSFYPNLSQSEVTRDEIDTLLGKEIYMYRISTYMWHIKTIANGIIRINKDGRKVISYQLVNVEEVKEYMKRVGVLNTTFAPGQTEKKPSISKLADLQPEPVVEVSDNLQTA